ncbi:hypothetical protein [Geoalkalibacter sp.]|uniref:hypothetical protein n=1 Tax=Geoalkalibacter sp. TaxID=3041440 RepID=UPI00272E1576|nr:hypothetical protein [Geoalkalibacter sp.]
MRDRVMEAVEELQEKNPFVCISCDPHDIPRGREKTYGERGDMLHDRFTEAVAESGEKSAFVCESCTH